MKHPSDQASYFDTLTHRKWITWLWATLGAVGLNLALFSGMPHLLRPLKNRPAFDELVSQINVIRLKRPETPVKRKPIQKPPKPPPKKQPRPKALLKQPHIATRLSLPFAVNPRLPAGPADLRLPPMAPAQFDTSGLDNIFGMGDLDSPLMVLSRIPPIYPLHAKRQGTEGWVRVRFIVTKKGQVDNITVIESKPPGVFDSNVINCVAGWRFRPPTVEGIPVKTAAETTIRFKLN